MKPAEDYILNQSEPFRSILLHLQMLIESTLPEASLKFKWRIPCYYVGNTPVCYLNVSQKKKYVDVGFWNSTCLTKHLDKLIAENRKVVRSLRYTSLQEIDAVVLMDVLKEASELKSKGFYNKNDMKRN